MPEPTTSHAPGHPAGSGPADTEHRYSAALANAIEPRWQQWWAEHNVHRQPNPGEPGFDASRPKFYCLDMFPYPSGAGLHVGHPEGYTATDILCRYKRMHGFQVLHPMGWDAFGLPAEQYAIQTGVHPAVTTKKAIDTFRRQLQRFGFSYDWSREFGTIDEDYYRWTQWIFVQIYHAWFDPAAGELGRCRPIAELLEEFRSGRRAIRLNPDAAEFSSDDKAVIHPRWDALDEPAQHRILSSYRLAYLGEQTVNWCPKLGTALANEEVIDGRSERGGFPVFRKPLRQWMFRITALAERLLADLPNVDWPESTRTQQAEWIGRSEGAEIDFVLSGAPADFAGPLRVYTTRPDTLFGATYMVVAPEHPLVTAVLSHPGKATDAHALGSYVAAAKNRTDVERQEAKKKTGVYTGVDAVNPATGERIPVWCADYVLMGYGTGAIMAVPAGDDRDYEFAKVFGLPIRDVVYPAQIAAMAYYAKHATGEGDWRTQLADFLGLVTNASARPEQFAELLATVRTRRGSDEGHEPERRASVRQAWDELLGSMGDRDFAALRKRFADAQHFARQGEAYTGAGRLANSRNAELSLDGLTVADAKAAMIAWLERRGLGTRKVNYRLRDWLFSRQRYWGEPFPIVFDERGLHHAVAEDRLPVRLPPMEDYHPVESADPQPLLAKATDWARTTAADAGVLGLPGDAPVTRETNTMPGWAGSCWYYLRYCDPKNAERFVGRGAERYWMLGTQPGVARADAEKFGTFEPHLHRTGGVDLYIGGNEHAVLHLLYARFWHKVLFDLGEVSTPEPFQKLFHQGLITSHAFQRADKSLVAVDLVDEKPDGSFVERSTGEPVTQIVAKMSKSLKNVVNPDEVIAEYGADTFRLYEMYMGPLEASKPWNTRDIIGLFRFCQRAWRLCIDETTGQPRTRDADRRSADTEKKLHRTIAKVGSDIEKLSFNTAIAALIEFVNAATPSGSDAEPGLTADQRSRFVRTLAPFAPHLAEEIWHRSGEQRLCGPVAHQPWPGHDESMLRDTELEIPVQVLGKVRSKVTVPADADARTIEAAALADPRIAEILAGKAVKKVIVVPGRLVNIVAG
jgi:leucyl-tRNA synthetase